MKIALLILVSIFLIVASHAATEKTDITEQLRKLIACNAAHYVPAEGQFEIEKFNDSWEQCAEIRTEMLDSLPETERPIWIDRFEKIRTSLIDRFQPQPELPGYGLSPSDPVKIGGLRQGPKRTYAYFERLRDENGKSIQFRRVGSCCRFRTPNAIVGEHAALDKYEISSDQFKSIVTVYVNIYDEGDLQALEGFTLEDDI